MLKPEPSQENDNSLKSHSLFKTKSAQLEEREKYFAECRLALCNMCGGLLEINGRKVRLAHKIEIGHGGFKKIFDIGDGKVLALRNNNDGFSMSNVKDWVYATSFEANMSEKLHNIGLQVQDYQKIEVKIDGHIVPALTMTNFKELLSKGLQIRGGSSEKFGTSMLFGSVENIKSEIYIRQLFKYLIKDIITLIANKINLSRDSFDTLVIKDTNETPLYDKNRYGSVVDRKQEIHFYMVDFFEKQIFFQRDDLEIADNQFNPNMPEITRIAKLYLSHAQSILFNGITDHEEKQLGLGWGDIIEIKHEMYNKIENDLINQICNGVITQLKKEKLTQLDNVTKLTKSLSTLSHFSRGESDDEENEQLTCIDTGLRNSMSQF